MQAVKKSRVGEKLYSRFETEQRILDASVNSLSFRTVSVLCCKPLKRLSDSVVIALTYPGLSKRP